MKPDLKTRTVRKSDYTPALALPKHVAGIFDEKCREKEKYRKEQIGECPFSIPLQLVIVNLYTKFKVSILNGCGDIFRKSWRERKKNKYKEEQIGECPFAFPKYNLLLRISIPNFKLLS